VKKERGGDYAFERRNEIIFSVSDERDERFTLQVIYSEPHNWKKIEQCESKILGGRHVWL